MTSMVEILAHSWSGCNSKLLYTARDYDLTGFTPILNAITSTRTRIEDLQFGMEHAPSPRHVARMLHDTGIILSRCRIRIEIDPQRTSMYAGSEMWKMFGLAGVLNNLTHLTIYMTRQRRFRDIQLASANMLVLLGSVNHIQQLAIRGPWRYTEDELIALVSKHSKTLRQFALKSPVLEQGRRKSAVQPLLRIQFCSMQYLELSNMKQYQYSTLHVTKVEQDKWREFQENAKQIVEDAMCHTICLSDRRNGHMCFARLESSLAAKPSSWICKKWLRRKFSAQYTMHGHARD